VRVKASVTSSTAIAIINDCFFSKLCLRNSELIYGASIEDTATAVLQERKNGSEAPLFWKIKTYDIAKGS
jgi:hypothetical protein